MTLLRRYAPFLAVIAAVLLAVAVAPSKALHTTPSFALGASGDDGPVPGLSGDGGTPAAPDGTTADPSASTGTTGGPAGSTGTAAGGGGTTTTPGSGGTAKPGTSGAAGAPGDTSHCVGKKQFGGYAYAPPCVPTFSGSNGGATYQGVTATTIELVYYREMDNQAVKAIEQGAGLYAAPADQMAYLQALQTFANSHYELYGRKIHIDFYQGACTSSPPDPSCFASDAKAVNDQFHPFGVVYDNNTNAPDFFTTLSQLGVVNFGGWGFTDTFDVSQRPFHWDFYTGGNTQASYVGNYYCNRLANKKAVYAGQASLQGMNRKAAIIVPQIDDTENSAKALQKIIDGCDTNGAEIIPYSPDASTSATQASTIAGQMANDKDTTVLWLSDPIAPVYLTSAMTTQEYFPEQVIAGVDLLDYDALAQLYDKTQWAHAFGPSDLVDPTTADTSEPTKLWQQTGHTGDAYDDANLPFSYFSILLDGIQESGPTLNPGTFERGEFAMPAVAGAADGNLLEAELKYSSNHYTGVVDQREVYWDPNGTSPINGKAGRYDSADNDKRYANGQWPMDNPHIPASV